MHGAAGRQFVDPAIYETGIGPACAKARIGSLRSGCAPPYAAHLPVFHSGCSVLSPSLCSIFSAWVVADDVRWEILEEANLEPDHLLPISGHGLHSVKTVLRDRS